MSLQKSHWFFTTDPQSIRLTLDARSPSSHRTNKSSYLSGQSKWYPAGKIRLWVYWAILKGKKINGILKCLQSFCWKAKKKIATTILVGIVRTTYTHIYMSHANFPLIRYFKWKINDFFLCGPYRKPRPFYMFNEYFQMWSVCKYESTV